MTPLTRILPTENEYNAYGKPMTTDPCLKTKRYEKNSIKVTRIINDKLKGKRMKTLKFEKTIDLKLSFNKVK